MPRQDINAALIGTTVLLAVGIFVLDFFYPLGVAVGALYTPLVLITLWSAYRRFTLIVAIGASLVVLYKRAEEERDVLVRQLQHALANIKTLHGLLPICSSCKKIRDDHGYWNQLETYIGAHTDAEFTHGLCPECIQKLYPDYARDK